MTRRSPRRSDARQLKLDWSLASQPAAAAEPPQAAAIILPPAPNSDVPPVVPFDRAPLVQYLPWDFCTSFPPVLPDAINAGIVTEEDALPENRAELHAAHGDVILTAMRDLDAAHHARRQGIDLKTGRPPRSPAKKADLGETLDREIARLKRWQRNLLESYEAAFGSIAVEAFERFISAQHYGIEVRRDPALPRSTPSAIVPSELPIPAPQQQSVLAGVFGQDDEGPVEPSEEEVLAITRDHAEALTELLEIFQAAADIPSVERTSKAVLEAVEKYAEDFGQPAADTLHAYCRRQVLLNKAEMLHFDARL